MATASTRAASTAGASIVAGQRRAGGEYLRPVALGRMTLSVISDGVVWPVFGHALPEKKDE